MKNLELIKCRLNKLSLSKIFQTLFLIFFCLIFISSFVLFSEPVSIADAEPPGGFGEASCDSGTICNPLKYRTLQDLIKAILEQIAIIGSIIVVFFMVYSGFLFVSARGNEEKLKKAKWTFFGTVVGAVLIIGAWAISLMIQRTVEEILR